MIVFGEGGEGFGFANRFWGEGRNFGFGGGGEFIRRVRPIGLWLDMPHVRGGLGETSPSGWGGGGGTGANRGGRKGAREDTILAVEKYAM